MFTLLDLNDELWTSMKGAYGMVLDTFKDFQKGEKSERNEILEDLYESISHQMSFYKATYIVLPHLIKELLNSDDVKWQITLISHIGIVVSTYNEFNNCKDGVDESIIENFENALKDLIKFTKNFIIDKLEVIKELENLDKEFFAIAVLAIIGDAALAYALINCSFSYALLYCRVCETENEDIEEFNEEIECIKPADSVIGMWDKKDFSNEYIWFANYLDMLGLDEKVEITPYYYGTYTCINCGKVHTVKSALNDYFIE